MQISLDGFVAGPNGEGDWIFASGPDPVGFNKIIEIAESCDTLLLGRKMAADFIEHWEDAASADSESPMKELGRQIVQMRKIVFSRTQKEIAGKNVEMENGDLATVVNTLKKQTGKDILVYGGASFVSSLISQNLIDEYLFITCPIALGSGLTIFKEKKLLKLDSSTSFKNGKVLNRYL